MPQGPALRLVTLREAQVEAESGPTSEQPMKRAQDAQEEEKEAKASKKKPPYLTVLPKAMLRFTRATKRKKAKLSALKKAPGKQSAGSAGDRCGLGCLVIPFCQRFNSIQWFMAFYCVLLVCQGIVFGLIDLSNNDFEQHHILTTTEKLALTLSYDISSCLVAVFIAYYGGSGNRIKWIAFSSFLVGFGSLLLAFPYFGVKSYESEVKTEDICSTTKILDPCLRSKSSFQAKYVTFFALGQIVQGMAGMPLYILGITFLDDNVYTHSSGIYLGIADAAAILGYALGYAIGAPQLESSQNSTSQAENVLSPAADVQQGKNWWPDFLFVSLLAWSTLIPFLCFPYNIAGTAKIRARKQKEFYMFDSNLKYWKFGPSIKELFGAVWMLLKTPVFMYQALSKASESLIIIGATEFLPIYLENQFILTPAMAASLTGLILIPGGALGQLLGGIIVCQLEMSCKALMRFIIASCTVSIVFLGILIFVHCDPVRFAGINENYNG